MIATTELAQDGAVIWSTLAEPARGLGHAVTRRRATTALLVGTLAALLSAAVVVPHLDMEKGAAGQLRPDMTPHEREEALATATKLETVRQWAGAAVAPAALAALAAAALFLAFRVAGTSPGFKDTLAVTSHAFLPLWLKALLTLPAVVLHAPVAPADVERLLPSSLAALPLPLPPPAMAALSSLDLFSLWAAYLVGSGMARASGASRRRAFVVTAILFVAYVCLFKVAPAAAAAAGGPGPRGGM
jgi:hypothetical protein